jgi:hypothetical protein
VTGKKEGGLLEEDEGHELSKEANLTDLLFGFTYLGTY